MEIPSIVGAGLIVIGAGMGIGRIGGFRHGCNCTSARSIW